MLKSFDYKVYSKFIESLAKKLTKFYYSKLNKPFKVSNKLNEAKPLDNFSKFLGFCSPPGQFFKVSAFGSPPGQFFKVSAFGNTSGAIFQSFMLSVALRG